MQKYIFLDFDGVLNTENYHRELVQNGQQTSDLYGPLFSPDAVRNLEIVIQATEASIVISSSWKMEGLDKMRQLWSDRKMPGTLLGITSNEVFPFNLLDMDLDNPAALEQLAGKGNEIKRWLEEHAPANLSEYRYAIFDDVMDFLPSQKANFIEIDPRTGITTENAFKAIALLNQ